MKKDGGDEGDDEDVKDDKEESDAEKRRRALRMKMLAILNSLTWATVLTKCQFDRYEDVFAYLDTDVGLKKIYDELVFDDVQSMSCNRIVKLISKEADGKTLNSIISKFNMDAKEKPKELVKMLKLDKKFADKNAEVFTPVELIEEMLSKLPDYMWTNKDLKWIDPACGTGNFLLVVRDKLMEGLKNEIVDDGEREQWIMEKMLYGVDLQERNMILCKLRLDFKNKYKLNVIARDSLNFDFWGEKFDVVVGNPPYQSDKNKTNKGTSGMCGGILWDKFMLLAMTKICKPNGYIIFVNPGQWRKPEHDLMRSVKERNLKYLSIHNLTDGDKVFNKATGYDWYVLQNCQYEGKTEIVDIQGVSCIINLDEWDFIPNGEFNKINGMIAREMDEKCETVFSYSAYETMKKYGYLKNIETILYILVYMGLHKKMV